MIKEFWNWLTKKKEKPNPKMMLNSRDMGGGKFEVNGVVFYADSHSEALKKYTKGSKNEPQSETKNI